MKNSLIITSKRISFLLILLITGFQSFSQSNWTSLMPKPLGFLVFDASFSDANNGWAVGESGCIAKTTNGGLTWNYKSIPLFTGNGLTNFRPALNQVQFLNTNVGYTVGNNGAFLKTTDGGNSWVYINGPLGPVSSTGKTIYNLFFFDVNNGWLIGDAPNTSAAFIYKTTDAGATWTAATNVPVINTPFFGIDFIDPSTGYICGQSGKVIKTSDAGATWTDISLTTTNYTVVGGTATLPRTQTYRCVLALDANTAIISSQNNGCVLRTTNGGTSWYASGNQGVGIPQMATWQMAKSGPNKDTILIAGGQARLAKSTDRGMTWITQQHYTGSTNSYNYYYAPVTVPGVPGKYIMMGASGIANISNDGGNTWSNPYSSLGTYDGSGSSDAKNLSGISFIDANSGMVVGAHGTLATTSNGGANWTDKSIAAMSQVTGNADFIGGVRCPSLTSSYICTANWGQILKSTDFGLNWTIQLDMAGTDGFPGMDFVDNNTGWVCSYLGAVYRTTSGTTWTQVPSFTSTQMNAIDFIDANTGWVVGNSGKIFKTTNGGTSWVAQTSGITTGLYSVQFLDANNGFTCGSSGKVLITTDGGTTWTQLNTSTTSQLNKILFLDNLKGMVFGFTGGVYYSTSDGGLSWNPLYAPTGDGLMDAVIPAGSNNIIVAGGSLFGVHGDILSLDNSQCTLTITAQPVNTSVCAGSTANFNVTVSGALFATYQWQLSTDGGASYNNIAGATSSAYTFTPTGTENGYKYRCLITNSCGSPTTIASSAGTLSFNSVPVVTQQPGNTSVCLGSPATFSVQSTGTGLTYQWQISTNGGTSFSNISTGAVYLGATINTLTIIAVAATQNTNQFRCVVTGLCSPAVNSLAGTLTIPVIITTQPSNITQCAGSNASFSIVTTGAGVIYQWQVSTDGGTTFNNITNGAVYSGATTATLNITGITGTMNNYKYRCVASAGTACGLTSSAVTLTVNTAPAIVSQPASTTGVCSGQNTTINVNATGTALTYQWQVSTDGGTIFTNVINSAVYSGAGTASLSITGALANMNNYQYKCVIGGTCTPAVTTTVSTLNVSLPASITAQAANTSVCSNITANFSVTATGTIIAYQWQVSTNGGASFSNITGASTNNYSIAAIYSMNGNQYRCVITTVCSGNLTSNAATLTVFQIPGITIAANPTTNLYPGLRSTLGISSITPVGAASYTWMKNGVNIPGATNSTLNVGVDDAGSYSVAVTDQNGCPGVSNSVVIGLVDASKLFIYPNPSSGNFQVRFYSTQGNTNPRSLNIYDAGGARVYSQVYPINGPYQRMDVNLSNASSGIYTVVLLDNNGNKLAVGKIMIYK